MATFPLPNQRPAFRAFKAEQARISRRRLYPLTAFYLTASVLILGLALQTPHPWVAAAMFALGLPTWTLVEYLFHRYVLHGRFPKRTSRLGRWMHDRLDPLHWEHHERPFDGAHISGQLSDLIWLFLGSLAVSLLLPLHTAPALLAGTVLGYVIEEWIHHSVHFYEFRNRYFRYLQRYHRYHHSEAGMEQGYGLTSGLWDWVFGTQFPATVLQAVARQRSSRR